MSPVREHYNPAIISLLREHDRLPHDKVDERKSFQRQILFLMNAIKAEEFETSFSWCLDLKVDTKNRLSGGFYFSWFTTKKSAYFLKRLILYLEVNHFAGLTAIRPISTRWGDKCFFCS